MKVRLAVRGDENGCAWSAWEGGRRVAGVRRKGREAAHQYGALLDLLNALYTTHRIRPVGALTAADLVWRVAAHDSNSAEIWFESVEGMAPRSGR